MKLYHGTSFSRLQDVLNHGIRPRGKGDGNWDKYPSHPDMVYLSSAYPFYFSYVAASEADEDKCLVFEIDMDHAPIRDLYPDEDFIWQAHPKEERPPHAMIVRSIDFFQKEWQKSLEHMGNVSFMGEIPAEWITRYCVVDFSGRTWLSMEVMDPVISILNYKVCADKYENLVKWFFGDIPLLPGVTENEKMLKMMAEQGHEEGTVEEGMRKAIELWKKESKNRTGIEVFSL